MDALERNLLDLAHSGVPPASTRYRAGVRAGRTGGDTTRAGRRRPGAAAARSLRRVAGGVPGLSERHQPARLRLRGPRWQPRPFLGAAHGRRALGRRVPPAVAFRCCRARRSRNSFPDQRTTIGNRRVAATSFLLPTSRRALRVGAGGTDQQLGDFNRQNECSRRWRAHHQPFAVTRGSRSTTTTIRRGRDGTTDSSGSCSHLAPGLSARRCIRHHLRRSLGRPARRTLVRLAPLAS